MCEAEQQRNERDEEGGPRHGRSGEHAVEQRAADRGVHRIAPKDGVERSQSLTPPLAGVAFADGPGQENHQGNGQIVKEELESHLRPGRLLRRDLPHGGAVGGSSSGERIDSDRDGDDQREQEGARLHTDFAGVILLEKNDQQHQKYAEDQHELHKEAGQVAAFVAGIRAAVAVFLPKVPPADLIAVEKDIEVRDDLTGREFRGDAIAEGPVGTAPVDGRPRRLEPRRRSTREGARVNEGFGLGPQRFLRLDRPRLFVPPSPACSQNFARFGAHVNHAVRDVLVLTATVVRDVIDGQSRTDHRVVAGGTPARRITRERVLQHLRARPHLGRPGLVHRDPDLPRLPVRDDQRRGARDLHAPRLRRCESRQH